MPGGRINPPIKSAPPIPFSAWERPIPLGGLHVSTTLRYVFNNVMGGIRGAIDYDQGGDNLILYLMLTEEDERFCNDLQAGTEVWIALKVRDM